MKIFQFFSGKKKQTPDIDAKPTFYETSQKKQMYALNIKHNQGWVRSDLDGTVLEKNDNG